MNLPFTADGEADRISSLSGNQVTEFWVAVGNNKIYFGYTFNRLFSMFRIKLGTHRKEMSNMSGEKKIRIPLWIYPSTDAQIQRYFHDDNCRSPSEFIEKAVRFYIGYLNEEENINYISPMITETVKATIAGTEQRLSRLLFKVAVELGKISNMLAAVHDIDDETLRQLQSMCVNEVRRINGIISYEDAVEFQKE